MMKTAIWLVVLAIVGIYVAVAFVTVDRGKDQAQIAAVINRGVAATQIRDLSSLISCISPNYSDEAGLNYDRLRILLAQAMRNETGYSIITSKQVIRIDGSRATVNLHVTLKHAGGDAFYDRDLTILLAKERARHMLIAPEKAWRVIGSKNLGLDMGGSAF
jgi:hypothetical protein